MNEEYYRIGMDFGSKDGYKTVYSAYHIKTGIMTHASTEEEARRLCREEVKRTKSSEQ
jgi:hypothetical protein